MNIPEIYQIMIPGSFLLLALFGLGRLKQELKRISISLSRPQ